MKTRIGIIAAIVYAGLILCIGVAQGQESSQTPVRPVPPVKSVQPVPPVPPVPPVDPLDDVMFPPEQIIRHARALGLTDEQKTLMRGEIQRVMVRFNELQWKLQEAMDALHQTLDSTSVSEEEALSKLDKVLEIEREIKRLHIGMGIRLKNHLAPEQQEKLRAMNRAARPFHQGP